MEVAYNVKEQQVALNLKKKIHLLTFITLKYF